MLNFGRSKKAKAKKMPMGITPEFLDIFNSAGLEEKKSMFMKIQKDLDEAQTFLKTNEEIVDLREQLKLVEGPTRDAIKVQKNRTKYIIDEFNKQGAV